MRVLILPMASISRGGGKLRLPPESAGEWVALIFLGISAIMLLVVLFIMIKRLIDTWKDK